jgi:hypothetical protein
LPRYQAVVFDEAHLVAEVATQACSGWAFPSARVNTLLPATSCREAPSVDDRKAPPTRWMQRR